jgi:hypothetical protein
MIAVSTPSAQRQPATTATMPVTDLVSLAVPDPCHHAVLLRHMQVSKLHTDRLFSTPPTAGVKVTEGVAGCGQLAVTWAALSVDDDGGAMVLAYARCAFSDRSLHSMMKLDPTHVRMKRSCGVVNGIPLGSSLSYQLTLQHMSQH